MGTYHVVTQSFPSFLQIHVSLCHYSGSLRPDDIVKIEEKIKETI